MSSRWSFACCCCGVMVTSGRLNSPSLISATPLPLAAQPPLPQTASVAAAQAVPALGCGQLPAVTHPQLALEGSWDIVPCRPFLSHCVPRESGHRVGAAGSLFLCTVLISEDVLGGKETQACLSPHVTCLHFFSPFFLSLLFFPFLKKNK